MGDLQNATITVAAIEEDGNRDNIKVKSTLGQTYSFFKEKQDKTLSLAYRQMGDMDIKVGSTVDIAYDKTPNERYPKYPYKNIKSFRETNVRPIEAEGQPTVEEYKDNEEEKTLGMVRHGVVTAMIQKGIPKEEIFSTAEEYVNFIMTGVAKEAEGSDDVDVSNIPL